MTRPLFIQHRVNSIAALLSASDLAQGCEIDLRSDVSISGGVHLAHDPWQKGENFEDWLQAYTSKGFQGPLILNTKEDGLEPRAIELMKKYSIANYFFLDTTVPTLVKYAKTSMAGNFAVRLSKFEGLDFLKSFEGKVGWVWIDCFDGEPMNSSVIDELKAFKTCLVSPELQGQDLSRVNEFVDLGTQCTAICTKAPDVWKAKL